MVTENNKKKFYPERDSALARQRSCTFASYRIGNEASSHSSHITSIFRFVDYSLSMSLMSLVERKQQFIEMFKEESVLWDREHKYYKHSDKRLEAWKRLSKMLGRPVQELKRVNASMMATYRGLTKRAQAAAKNGETFVPVWYAYKFMDSFLRYSGHTNNQADENSKSDSEMEQETRNLPEVHWVTEGESHDQQNFTDRCIPAQRSQNQTTASDCEAASGGTLRRKNYEGSFFKEPKKARPDAPSDITEASIVMKKALKALNKIAAKHQHREDELELFGRMVTKKLKRLPEEERMQMMHDIDGLFLAQFKKTPVKSYSSSPPPLLYRLPNRSRSRSPKDRNTLELNSDSSFSDSSSCSV